MRNQYLILFIISAICAFCILQSSHASQSTVKYRNLVVIGYGSSEQDALQSALIEAIRRVHGVTITSQEIHNLEYSSESVSEDGTTSSKVGLSGGMRRSGTYKQNGYLHSYEIIQFYIDNEGFHNCEAKVVIPYYEAPGFSPESRRSLAVLPSDYHKNHINFPETNLTGDYVADSLTQAIVSEITQTRRFAVVDRENILHYFKEKNLILSCNSSISEHVRFGNVIGADYILVTSVDEAYSGTNTIEIPMVNETRVEPYGLIKVSYRIIVTATQQIKWAGTVTLAHDSPELMHLSGGADRYDTMADMLIKGVSHRITSDLIENVYPIRVVSVSGNQIIVNQGGQTISDNNVFSIYSLGEMLKDPYSGEQLGYIEHFVGHAKVVRVTSKTAYLELIEGQMSLVKPGCIIRREHDLYLSQTKAPHEKRSGVKLPFD